MTRYILFVAFGFLLLFPAFAAELTVSGSILGPDGVAVEGAHVWCIQGDDVRTTTSGADGAFSLGELRPGGVDLTAWKDGFAVGGVSFRMVDDAFVPLTLGIPTTMKLRMVGSSMAPVEGVRVDSMVISDAIRVDLAVLGPLGYPVPRSMADGSLAIDHLPQRSYLRFSLVHPDFASTYVAYYATGRPEQDIVMQSGVDVAGRVVDEQGNAVADARVRLSLPTVSGERLIATPTSDREGYFRAKVRPGEIIVVAEHPDYARTDDLRVRVNPRGEQAEASITLYPAEQIRARVVTDAGEPFPDVAIRYSRHEVLYQTAVTGADGVFGLEVLPGPGTMEIIPPPGWMNEKRGEFPIRMEKDLDIDLGDFMLRPLPEVTGTVTDRDGNPAEGVFVRSLDLETPVWDLTDDKGHFTLNLRELPPDGEIRFEAEHALRFQRGRFTLDPVIENEHDVQLRKYRPDETIVRADTIYAVAESEEFQNADASTMTPVANQLSGLQGKPAPALSCVEWFNGDAFKPDDYRGKVIVLTLWAGFANMGPARARMEELNWLYTRYSEEDDVAILSVHDNGVEKEGVEKYIEAFGIEFPVGLDNESADTFLSYRTQVIPQTFLIDRQGRIRYYDVDDRLIELIKVLRREPA